MEALSGLLLLVWTVVLACSLIQSLFGVGLLLFGTPVLLLLGTPFYEALWVLLPPSLAISGMQLLIDRRIDHVLAKTALRFALPALIVGLVLGGLTATPRLELLVSALLLAAAVLRMSDRAAARVRELAKAYEPALLAGIGLVHGLSNMGGGVLTAYASARHADKLASRQAVALVYALFAATQLLVLSIVDRPRVGYGTVVMILTALGVFLSVGRVAFGRLATPAYSVMVTAMMVVVSLMLIARSQQ